MKILHITPYYHPAMGGAETYTKEVSERLALRGHAVTVLTMKGAPDGRRGELADSEVVNQVTVNRFESGDRLHSAFNRFLALRGAHRFLGLGMGLDKIQLLANGPYSLRPFRDSLRSQPDVVGVVNWYCGLLAYQICQARRLRDFALVGFPLFHTERLWSQSAGYPRMLNRCDAVIAMTEHEKQFIAERSAQPHTHVVGVGIDPSVFARADGRQIRNRYGIGDAPVVGYVGRMTAAKGVATLIDAMKRVWQTDPAVRLLLAGAGLPGGSNPGDDISRAVAALSPAERARTIMIGRFPDADKAAIFDALDVFAMPSVGESFGIAYLEAWTRRKAVIGSRLGSTQCVIDDGVDGLLVSPGDPEELSGAILRLLSDRATRERMGCMGQSKTLDHFTWDKITDKVERIYNQAAVAVLQQPSNRSRTQLYRGGKSPSTCA